ncbi:hypothetical protein [Actinomyces vulturis]|uniref:hypothetical protein n=1 Tax=Actinomyces vulturis TaxID=1857645 RepID=UPI00082AB823|nr:hypothetical protein [Actinomyces vulturis]
MAQESSQRWNRTEGVVIAPNSAPEDVARELEERRVVARLEWFPDSLHLLSLTLMTDSQGRVAVTPPQRGGVVAGMDVSELTQSLARALEGSVAIGPASYDAMPSQSAVTDPGGDDAALSPESYTSRTVVISPLSAYTVPLQATLLERPLAVMNAPDADRRVVMYTGPGYDVGCYGWDEEALPALIVRVTDKDMSIRAVPAPRHGEGEVFADGEDEGTYSWGMRSLYVWGDVDDPGPALRNLVEEFLTDRQDAQVIASCIENVEWGDVAQAMAMPGFEGLRACLKVLHLPDVIADVLSGATAPADVPGIVIHEPRGLSNAVGRSVGMLLQDPDAPGSSFWQAYIRTATDLPWVVRLATVVEAGVGGALLGSAIRRRSRFGSLPAGRVAAGVVLLIDAVAESSLASWTRRRELRRRAEENLGGVAEELGA